MKISYLIIVHAKPYGGSEHVREVCDYPGLRRRIHYWIKKGFYPMIWSENLPLRKQGV